MVFGQVEINTIHIDNIVSVVDEGIVDAEVVKEIGVRFGNHWVGGTMGDGVVLKCHDGIVAVFCHKSGAEAAVDQTVLHREFCIAAHTYHASPFGVVGAAAEELDVFELVVGAVGIDVDVAPGAVVGVVGRATEYDGVLFGAHHAETCVLAYVDAAAYAGEHDGDAGLDGEEGVAVYHKIAVNHIVHGETAIGPCGVGRDGAAPYGRIVSSAAGSVAEGCDIGGVLRNGDGAGIVGVVVVPCYEVAAGCRNGGNLDFCALCVGSGTGNCSPGFVVRLYRNGLLFHAG